MEQTSTKEDTEQLSETRIQAIKYRMAMEYYDSESVKKRIAEAIIDNAKYFEKPTDPGKKL